MKLHLVFYDFQQEEGEEKRKDKPFSLFTLTDEQVSEESPESRVERNGLRIISLVTLDLMLMPLYMERIITKHLHEHPYPGSPTNYQGFGIFASHMNQPLTAAFVAGQESALTKTV